MDGICLKGMPAGFASRGIYPRAFCFNGYNFDMIYLF
jgi:hypothetical protein